MDRASSTKWAESYFDNNSGEEGSARRPSPQAQQQAPQRMSSTTQQPQPTHVLYTRTLPPIGMDVRLYSRKTQQCGEVEHREYVQLPSAPRSDSRTATHSDRSPGHILFPGDKSARTNVFRKAAFSSVYNMPPQPPLRADNSASKPIDQQAPTPPMPGSFDDSHIPPSPAPWWETKPKDEVPMSNQAVKLPKSAPKEPVKETPSPASGMLAPNYVLHPPRIAATPTNSDCVIRCHDCKRNFSSRVRYDDHHMLGGCMPNLSSAKAKAEEWMFRSRKSLPVLEGHKGQAPAETYDTFCHQRDADRRAKAMLDSLVAPPPPTDTLLVHKPKPAKTFSAEETERLERVWQPTFHIDKEAARKAVEEGAKMWAKPMKPRPDPIKASLSKEVEEKQELHKQVQRAMGERKEPTDSSITKAELKTPTKAQELKKTTEPLQKKLNKFLQKKRDNSAEESDQAHAVKVLKGIIQNAVDSPAPKEEPNTPTEPLGRKSEAAKINTFTLTDEMRERMQEQTQKQQEQFMQMRLRQQQQHQEMAARNQQLMTAYHQIRFQQYAPKPAVTETEKEMSTKSQEQVSETVKANVDDITKVLSQEALEMRTKLSTEEKQNALLRMQEKHVRLIDHSAGKPVPAVTEEKPHPVNDPVVKSARKPRTTPTTIYPSYKAPATNKVKKSSWVSVSMPKSSTTPEKKVVKGSTREGKRVLRKEAKLSKLSEQEERVLAAGFEDLSLESKGEEGWEKVEGDLGEWEVVDNL